MSVTIDDVHEAARRIRQHLIRTPIVRTPLLDEAAGTEVYLKCESLQVGGAFKPRGALNAVLGLSREELRSGVVTQSSGNHAMALSFAAKLAGIPAYIAMPRTARAPKVELVKRFGGIIRFCEPNDESRRKTAAQLMDETGARLVHPFEDPLVIAGQGTVALELLEQAPIPEVLVVPVGGGGLISGCAAVIKALSPKTQVIGVEPEGADDACRSLRSGIRAPHPAPASIADGLLTTVGERPFAIISRLVDDIVTVSEEEILLAMRALWQHAHLLVEPSGAVAAAAVLARKVAGQRIAVVVSGGNIECPWTAEALLPG